ncbi:MAG: type II secretion system protein GspJ, partial [Planctomycetota bacterium]
QGGGEGETQGHDRTPLAATRPRNCGDLIAGPAAPAPAGGSDLEAVAYGVQEGASGRPRGLVRERREALTAETVELGRPENQEEVAPEVVGLAFRYFDEGEWREEWDSASAGKLPRAVEATLWVRGEWRGEEILERFVARVYLPVAAEQPPEE